MQNDLFDKRLTDGQRALLKRLTDALAGMGCKYLIKTPDGEIISLGIKPATPAPAAPPLKAHKRGPLKYPYGYVTNYVRPFMRNILPGQVAEIPFHDVLTPDEVANGACKEAARQWGNGTYTSNINHETKTVEVLRTDGI